VHARPDMAAAVVRRTEAGRRRLCVHSSNSGGERRKKIDPTGLRRKGDAATRGTTLTGDEYEDERRSACDKGR
jgi:hypothetical protein